MIRNNILNKIAIAYGANPLLCNRNCELASIVVELSGGAITPHDTRNGLLRQILALI